MLGLLPFCCEKASIDTKTRDKIAKKRDVFLIFIPLLLVGKSEG